ncbi:MAG: hypothetical protein ACK4GL_03790 [Flavobacteriales bacterium]
MILTLRLKRLYINKLLLLSVTAAHGMTNEPIRAQHSITKEPGAEEQPEGKKNHRFAFVNSETKRTATTLQSGFERYIYETIRIGNIDHFYDTRLFIQTGIHHRLNRKVYLDFLASIHNNSLIYGNNGLLVTSAINGATFHLQMISGYRMFVPKSNFPLFDLNLGLGWGYTFYRNEHLNQNILFGFNNNNVVGNYNYFSVTKNFNNVHVVMGISRDFEIYNNVSVNLNYRYLHSFMPKFDYYFSTDGYDQDITHLRNTGSQHQLGVAMKFFVGRKKNPRRLINDTLIALQPKFSFVPYTGLFFVQENADYTSLNPAYNTRQRLYNNGLQLGFQMKYQFHKNLKGFGDASYLEAYTYSSNVSLRMLRLFAGAELPIQYKKGKNLFNLQAGAGFMETFQLKSHTANYDEIYQVNWPTNQVYDVRHIYTFDPLINEVNFKGYVLQAGDTLGTYFESVREVRKFTPLIMLAIEKNIRLRDHFYLGLWFRRQFGFQKLITHELEGNTKRSQGYRNGTGFDFAINLAFKFN